MRKARASVPGSVPVCMEKRRVSIPRIQIPQSSSQTHGVFFGGRPRPLPVLEATPAHSSPWGLPPAPTHRLDLWEQASPAPTKPGWEPELGPESRVPDRTQKRSQTAANSTSSFILRGSHDRGACRGPFPPPSQTEVEAWSDTHSITPTPGRWLSENEVFGLPSRTAGAWGLQQNDSEGRSGRGHHETGTETGPGEAPPPCDTLRIFTAANTPPASDQAANTARPSGAAPHAAQMGRGWGAAGRDRREDGDQGHSHGPFPALTRALGWVEFPSFPIPLGARRVLRRQRRLSASWHGAAAGGRSARGVSRSRGACHRKNWTIRLARPSTMMATCARSVGHVSRPCWRSARMWVSAG